MSMKLSIIIPVYNRSQFVAGAVRSATDAVMYADPDMEYEVFVVDDGSTDPETVSRLDSMSKNNCFNDRVTVFRGTKNLGWSNRINYHVTHKATGHWIHILHDDDRVHHGFYKAALAAPPEAVASITGFRVQDAQGNLTPFRHGISAQDRPGFLGRDFDERLVLQNPLQVCSVLFTRKAHQELGGFAEDLRYTPDWLFWVRLAWICGHMWFTPEDLAFATQHDGNLSQELRQTGEAHRDVSTAIYRFRECGIMGIPGYLCMRSAIRHAAELLTCNQELSPYSYGPDQERSRQAIRSLLSGMNYNPDHYHTVQEVLAPC